MTGITVVVCTWGGGSVAHIYGNAICLKKNELNEDILSNCKLNIWTKTKNELKKNKAKNIVGREFQTEF